MKKLQMFAASVALTLLLSASALADDGIIQTGMTPPTTPPPPPASSTTAPSDADGIIQTGCTANDTDVTISAIASALLQGAMALA
jgi:hypothetical protein